MFLILTYGEYDSQSSQKAWEVWYPHRKNGFATRKEAEAELAENGARGDRYWIVEAGDPVTPKRTVAVALAPWHDSDEE